MMESIQTTTVTLPRFGEMTYSENEVIEFPWGMPGFTSLHRWLFLTLETHPNFVWLQSLDDVNVAIPAADPWLIFEDYDPKLPPYAFMALDIREASDFTTLCVVVVTKDAQEMTMNLFAPIVVNLRTRKARQIMLENSPYSVRHPIPRKSGEAVIGAASGPASAPAPAAEAP
jgi:flagellar assembly factor FliW